MPTARETIVNKPLTGGELRALITRDFERLLDNDGMLSEHIAYGRVAYSLILAKHLDNPYHPMDVSRARSFPQGVNTVADSPQLGAVEQYPMADPSAEGSALSSTTLRRTITSPNAERIRAGIPLDAEVRNLDGTRTIEKITYPEQPELGEGDVRVEPTSAEEQAAYGLVVHAEEEEADA